MTLAAFNQLDAEAAADLIRPCADIPRWVESIVEARPFSNVEEALSYAATSDVDWTRQEVDGALAHHPRIGERAQGGSTEANMSRGEQAGVDADDEEAAAALLEGNRAYERKFDRIFLIRAAGRSAQEILSELERRLGNTEEDEAIEVAQQLREIALLRLEAILK